MHHNWLKNVSNQRLEFSNDYDTEYLIMLDFFYKRTVFYLG